MWESFCRYSTARHFGVFIGSLYIVWERFAGPAFMVKLGCEGFLGWH